MLEADGETAKRTGCCGTIDRSTYRSPVAPPTGLAAVVPTRVDALSTAITSARRGRMRNGMAGLRNLCSPSPFNRCADQPQPRPRQARHSVCERQLQMHLATEFTSVVQRLLHYSRSSANQVAQEPSSHRDKPSGGEIISCRSPPDATSRPGSSCRRSSRRADRVPCR